MYTRGVPVYVYGWMVLQMVWKWIVSLVLFCSLLQFDLSLLFLNSIQFHYNLFGISSIFNFISNITTTNTPTSETKEYSKGDNNEQNLYVEWKILKDLFV